MRRPCADREEKRVTRGSEIIRTRTHQEQLDLEQLDLADPNQRGLLEVAMRDVLGGCDDEEGLGQDARV
jgi:hypothetical protein